MEYRIIIDGTSPLNGMHRKAAGSFITEEGDQGKTVHPVLYCSDIDGSHPHFLCAKFSEPEGASSAYIPYAHILGIVEVVGQGKRRSETDLDVSAEDSLESLNMSATAGVIH